MPSRIPCTESPITEQQPAVSNAGLADVQADLLALDRALRRLARARARGAEVAASAAAIMARIRAEAYDAQTPELRRSGFTLIELMVVITIIAAILSLTFPAVSALKARQAKSRSASLVLAVAAAASTYRVSFISVPGADGNTARIRPIWDFRGDGVIDGEPDRDDRFTDQDRQDAAKAGYHGFIAQTGINLPAMHVDQQRRIVDSWGNPLRINRAAGIYGASGLGVWSLGPDGQPETADDITSWKDEHAP